MLKGRKLTYNERWEKELMRTVPIVMATPKGEKLRELAAAIRREHRTRQPIKG